MHLCLLEETKKELHSLILGSYLTTYFIESLKTIVVKNAPTLALKKLRIDGISEYDTTAEMLKALRQVKTIKSVSIINAGQSYNTLFQICESSNWRESTQKLRVPYYEGVFSVVDAMKCFPNLVAINLCGTQITSDALVEMVTTNTKWESIVLGKNNELTEEVADCIFLLQNLTTLKLLHCQVWLLYFS